MDTTTLSASRIHQLAEEARESDHLLEALKLSDEAMVKYQTEGDIRGIAEALLGKFLAYKHLFLKTKEEAFLIIGKFHIKASLKIATKYDFKDKLSTIYFSLGEANVLQKHYADAVEDYEKALEYYQGNNAMKGDYTYHWGEALYRAGNKEKGEQKLREGLDLIQKNAAEVDSFVAHVWESGAFLRLADLLYGERSQEAKEYLEKAGHIIESDDRLVIRKRQYEELKNELSTRSL